MADLYLRGLQSERKRLWAECRLKGLAKSTPERLRIEELDRLLAERLATSADQAGTSTGILRPVGAARCPDTGGIRKRSVIISAASWPLWQ